MENGDDLHALFKKAIESRRDELGKTWRQVANDGGIAYETVRAARQGKGKGPIPAPTRRALERGLEWPTRHIDHLMTGQIQVDDPSNEAPGAVAEPEFRDDFEQALWELATSRGLGERGAQLLIDAYRGDQIRQKGSTRLIRKKTG